MASSAVERATAAIIEMIASGQYWAGDRLPAERHLAEQLSLSRPSLREALGVLAKARILDQRQGAGTFVVGVDVDAVFDVRLQLEPFAAGLAAAHRTEEQLEALAKLVKALEDNLDDPETFAGIDRQIHRLVAEAAGNHVLVDTLDHLGELTRLSRAITSPSLDLRRDTRDHMRELRAAILVRNSSKAAAAMTEHLVHTRATARDALGRTQESAAGQHTGRRRQEPVGQTP